MEKNRNDLSESLIMDFSYHDAVITKITKNNNDITILFIDGWNEGQINELNFINCDIKCHDNLEGMVIYQFDDLVNFSDDKWQISFLVWTKDGLLDKVVIKSDNIISKKYEIKSDVREKLYGFQNSYFEESMKEIKKQIGEITLEKLREKSVQELLNSLSVTNKKDSILSDLCNYILVAEEDLNKEM